MHKLGGISNRDLILARDDALTERNPNAGISQDIERMEKRRSKSVRRAYLNERFVRRVFAYCRQNYEAIRPEQSRINQSSPVHYPLMKIVDMYFWQIGHDLPSHRAAATCS